jgi:predicted phosphodiesterase
MRLLILSDLHANLTAFDAALAVAEGKWDAAVCLGDVVGYGPDPAGVSEKLQTILILWPSSPSIGRNRNFLRS